MSKLIAIAFSDAHLHEWPKINGYRGDKLENGLEALKKISSAAQQKNVPVLFAGDLFHNDKSLSNLLFNKFTNLFRINFEYLGINFYAISGNHDQSKKNTRENPSPSWINTFSQIFKYFRSIDQQISISENFIIYGIPYYTNGVGFREQLEIAKKQVKDYKKFKILLLHTDLPGAKNSFGFEAKQYKDIPNNLTKFFKPFDLVLSGHIHLAQKLSKNVYMMGAINHQNSGDIGVDMGYWEIYSDRAPKFIKLKLPEYKYYDPKKGMPTDDHIYIPLTREKKSVVALKGNFNKNMSKKKLVKNYMKIRGIKSKVKKNALTTAITSS